jgi:short-subunit dehydrogenase
LNKQIAIVTGASSGIGLAISKTLNQLNYSVVGLGRNFDKINDNIFFEKIQINLTNIHEIENNLISYKNHLDLKLLIHCAGIGIFGMHEDLNSKDLKKMLDINFIAPIQLTQYFLRTLKKNKGTIISISSITAKHPSKLASAYSASKAGLSHFFDSIWEENRKYGLKVINIHPDIVGHTKFYNQTFFEEDKLDKDSFIHLEELSNLIKLCISNDFNSVIRDITIQPLNHKIKKKNVPKN